MARKKPTVALLPGNGAYDGLLARVASLLEQARRTVVRTTNAVLTATYWEVGRQIVEFEQGGRERAEYGEGIVDRLAHDLTARCGRGFSRRNVFQMKLFNLGWEISPTASGKLRARVKCPTASGESAGEKVQ